MPFLDPPSIAKRRISTCCNLSCFFTNFSFQLSISLSADEVFILIAHVMPLNIYLNALTAHLNQDSSGAFSDANFFISDSLASIDFSGLSTAIFSLLSFPCTIAEALFFAIILSAVTRSSLSEGESTSKPYLLFPFFAKASQYTVVSSWSESTAFFSSYLFFWNCSQSASNSL